MHHITIKIKIIVHVSLTIGRKKKVLGIQKHKLATIEKQSSDFVVTHQPLGNPKDNLLLLLEANVGVQRGVTPLAHWGVFSMSVSGA